MALKVRKDGAWVTIGSGIVGTDTIVADGPITADTAVILTDAGLAKSITTVAESQASSYSLFRNADTNNQVGNVQSVTWDTTADVALITWAIDSTDGSVDGDTKFQAGSMSGTSMSWGPSGWLSSGDSAHCSTVASNGKGGGLSVYLIGDSLKGKTYTVSGLTINPGSAFTITSSSNQFPAMAYLGEDGGSDYFATAYDILSSSVGEVKIIKHDGQNNTTVGADGFHFSDSTDGGSDNNIVIVTISSTKFVIFWNNEKAVVCTRSGTDISFGETSVIGGQSGTIVSGAYDPIHNKVVFVSADGVVKVCNVSGNSISWFFESRFYSSSAITSTSAKYPKVVITDKGQILTYFHSSTNGKQAIGTYNDTRDELTWVTSTWQNTDPSWVSLTKADDGKVVAVYSNTDSSGWEDGRSFITQTATTTLTQDNFLGFPNEDYTDGQTATINLLGKQTTQSGLTVNEKYYVQDDGTIGIGKSSLGVLAGKALSATSLLITPDYYDSDATSAGGGGGGGSGSSDEVSFTVKTESGAYTLVDADKGKLIIIDGNDITIPANTFLAGDTISLFNKAGITTSSIIPENTNLTVYLGGSNVTGITSLASKGTANILCVEDVTNADVFIVTGQGVS